MNPIGRPTRFEPEMCEQAHNYCLLGATNDELALFFAVSPSTVDRWIAERPEFGDAVRTGRIAADARVARGLYDRAVGYDRKVERQVVLDGAVKALTCIIHYPPNVQACIFWLRNRRRRSWSEAAPEAAVPVIDDIALLDAPEEIMVRHDGD
ncbi:MAG: helix-turn-helix domain-containing protein [Alphaproteobacteria bacterium]|nr:helix-turn-helix domain-containing protein [Alphaproteobacteria bacterium]